MTDRLDRALDGLAEDDYDALLTEADAILATHVPPTSGNMRGTPKCTSCGEELPCALRRAAAAMKARILVKRQDDDKNGV